jgi:hypothetical protein
MPARHASAPCQRSQTQEEPSAEYPDSEESLGQVSGLARRPLLRIVFSLTKIVRAATDCRLSRINLLAETLPTNAGRLNR